MKTRRGGVHRFCAVWTRNGKLVKKWEACGVGKGQTDSCRQGRAWKGVKLGEGKGCLQRFFCGAAALQSTGTGGKNCFFMWVQERPLSHGTAVWDR